MVRTSTSGRAGGTIAVVITVLVTLTAAGFAAVLLTNGGTSAAGGGQDRFTVRRGSFDITIPASGELAAYKQIEIRNGLEYRAVITWIIEEGKPVKAGDLLFKLADEEIRDKIKDAEDEVNTANSALVAAQSNLDIQTSESHSEIAKADLDVRLAELALQAWEEGEVVSKRQQLALELETAGKDYERLEERYQESLKLAAQNFISRDELKRDEIAMIEAKARLAQAELDAEVYESYVHEQEQAQKTSDLEQAAAERRRVEDRWNAELETARADVASKEHQFQSRKERLERLREQLELCAIHAPADGWVVYASSVEMGRSWRNEGQPPTVGTELSRNDLVIVLPDTAQMVASVKVNESLSGLIQPGQSATVISDAVRDVTLEGEVASIGVLAESGGWIDRNRRDYTVKIQLKGANALGLKPSMRCRAEISVGRAADTLFVPVQAIFREGPVSFVYVPEGSGYAQRPVALGQSSELYVAVLEGLQESEVVLLREPRPQEIVRTIGGQEQEAPAADATAAGPPGEVWAKR